MKRCIIFVETEQMWHYLTTLIYIFQNQLEQIVCDFSKKQISIVAHIS